MLNLNLSRQASKFLKKLPCKQAKQIAQKIIELRNNPYPHDSITLKGYPYRRTDIGEYRIIYEIEGEILQILIIGKRNDDEVYKHLKRQ
jgi:mRNA interferase RelE/StbE